MRKNKVKPPPTTNIDLLNTSLHTHQSHTPNHIILSQHEGGSHRVLWTYEICASSVGPVTQYHGASCRTTESISARSGVAFSNLPTTTVASYHKHRDNGWRRLASPSLQGHKGTIWMYQNPRWVIIPHEYMNISLPLSLSLSLFLTHRDTLTRHLLREIASEVHWSGRRGMGGGGEGKSVYHSQDNCWVPDHKAIENRAAAWPNHLDTETQWTEGRLDIERQRS